MTATVRDTAEYIVGARRMARLADELAAEVPGTQAAISLRKMVRIARDMEALYLRPLTELERTEALELAAAWPDDEDAATFP